MLCYCDRLRPRSVMLVTPQEAADALAVSATSINRWYTGTRNRRGAIGCIYTETLSEILGMDHRFMMAFLGGYDMVLDSHQAKAMLKEPYHDLSKHCRPVFIRPKSLRHGPLARYSLRRLLEVLEKRNARSHPRKGPRSRPILPPPDTLPPNEWGFVSSLVTRGKGLPSGRRTSLEDGRASSLPVREGQERGNGRSS